MLISRWQIISENMSFHIQVENSTEVDVERGQGFMFTAEAKHEKLVPGATLSTLRKSLVDQSPSTHI